MKKIIFSFLFAFLYLTGFTQHKTVHLKVMGSCPSGSPKIGYAIKLAFIVDKNKCDPLIGFVSMEEKKHHFEETLNTKGVKFSNFEKSLTECKFDGNIQQEIYVYKGDSIQIAEVIQIAKHHEIKINSVSPVYENKMLADQDEFAICALEQAIQKATYISKNLGYKNCILRSVDDDTSYLSLYGFDPEMLEGMESMLALLSSMSPETANSGTGIYNIIGNFEMY